MKVDFVVHGTSVGVTNAETIIEGEKVMAQVASFDVELVTTAERHGSLVLRFVGSSVEDARKLFGKDAEIVASFAAK